MATTTGTTPVPPVQRMLDALPPNGVATLVLDGAETTIALGNGRGFKSGGVGYMTAAKHTASDGTRYQVSITVSRIGSKEAAVAQQEAATKGK